MALGLIALMLRSTDSTFWISSSGRDAATSAIFRSPAILWSERANWPFLPTTRIGRSLICATIGIADQPQALPCIYLLAQRLPPLAVFQIPEDRAFKAIFKSFQRSPAEFLGCFCCVDRISEIMSWSVAHKLDERSPRPICWRKFVQ